MDKPSAQLVRSITLPATIILIISSIIGTGVYKKVAPMSADLLDPWLVLMAWVLGGLISLAGGLSNAEIAGMMAGAGGEYIYFKRIYGRFMAFLWGWSTFTVIKTAAVASIAYVFAQSFHSLLPLPQLPPALASLKIGVFTPLDNFGVKMLTALMIIVLTFLNTRGLKGAATFSTWITRLVITALIGIVISGLMWGGGSLENLNTPAAGYTPPANWMDFSFIKALFSALLAAFWAYEGWNTIGFLGGEIQNPNRNLPLALLFGLLAVMGIYCAVNFTYLYVLPVDDLIRVHQGQNEIAAVAVIRHFAGPAGVVIISILILITTLGCTNSTILMPPRVYYAMAQDGLFFNSAARIHPRFHTPNAALWIQCVWAVALVFSGSFDQLTDMLIFAAFFFYGATALGVFILRRREPDAPRPYRVWGYPFIPAIFVLFCVLLIIITFINHPREAGIGLALMLSGVPFYWYWNGKKFV